MKKYKVLVDRTDVIKCNTCEKAWTDDCPRKECWSNNYKDYEVEQGEQNER